MLLPDVSAKLKNNKVICVYLHMTSPQCLLQSAPPPPQLTQLILPPFLNSAFPLSVCHNILEFQPFVTDLCPSIQKSSIGPISSSD